MTKSAISTTALYWASFNRFELRLSGQCILDCSHSGQCDEDVAYWEPKVIAQIALDNFTNKPTADKIRAELADDDAWDKSELADDDANMGRLIWIAAGNILDDENPDCSEPLKKGEK